MTFRGQARRLLLIAICSLLLLSPISLAQETRGSIQGRVLDSSGAVVPTATVKVTNLATNVSLTAQANEEGLYQALFLLPGMYRLSAAASGFKTAVRDNIQLPIHERLQIDFTLEVGAITEQVQVTAEAPLLQTATANTGQIFGGHRLENMPIQHGSPFNLLFFAPGTITARAVNRVWQETSNLDQLSAEITFNGQPAGTSDWTIDGAPNVQSSKRIGPMNSPPVDIIDEVKVETAYDAGVGHTSGTIVNVSLKSGGNKPHGTAYGFFRDSDWNANTFFGNRDNQPLPPNSSKRWGASLEGPLYIPKIINGRDRTFFTYGYEGVHRFENNTTTTTVPLPAQLTGDFSQLLALGSQYQIYDPATIKPAANGRFSIQPFAGNIIPANRIDPIAKNVATHWTRANTTGEADGTNNFAQTNRAEPDDYFNHTWRIDHNISERNRIFARFSAMRRIAGPYFNWWDDPSQGNVFIGKSKQASFDDVYALDPRTVLNVRYSYSRFTGLYSPSTQTYDPAQLGFSPGVVKLLTTKGARFPAFNVAGLAGLGGQSVSIVATDIHALFANVNRQQGSHNFKVGIDMRVNRGNDNTLGIPAGSFNFDTTFTRGPFDNSPSSPGGLGQGLAAFLLGQPTGGYIDNNDSQANQSTYYALYFHDNWRATPKLTLDLGLRWEYEGPMTERFNRTARGFDANAAQAIEAMAKAAYAAKPDVALPVEQLRVRGGLLFAGVNGVPRALWNRMWRNFAPRFGFAYQISPKTVVRGGFGIYPIALGQSTYSFMVQPGFSSATDLIPTLDNGLTFIATLANPFPNGIMAPVGNKAGAATFIGRSLTSYNAPYDAVARTPYSMNWNLNLQRMLPGQFLVEAGYAANKTVKLKLARPINAVPNQYLSTSFFRDQATINYLSANVANPFQGLLPGTGMNGATIGRSQLLKAFPHFVNINMQEYQGYSWFHSLQLRAERRFSRGMTVQAAYMFSKKMEATSYLNSGDPVPYRSISSIDRPHTLTLTSLYQLPFGRGRAFGGNVGRIPDLFIGGWEIGTGWQFQSGTPIGFGDVIFTGDLKDLPLARDQRTVDRWFNIDSGFDRNSKNARGSNLRIFPLRLSGLRTDVYNSWDMSAVKNFEVNETHRFQFRAEYFNVFNHPTSFDAPNTNPTSSAFGRVTGQSCLPRQLQMAVKYLF